MVTSDRRLRRSTFPPVAWSGWKSECCRAFYRLRKIGRQPSHTETPSRFTGGQSLRDDDAPAVGPGSSGDGDSLEMRRERLRKRIRDFERSHGVCYTVLAHETLFHRLPGQEREEMEEE